MYYPPPPFHLHRLLPNKGKGEEEERWAVFISSGGGGGGRTKLLLGRRVGKKETLNHKKGSKESMWGENMRGTVSAWKGFRINIKLHVFPFTSFNFF